MNDLNYSEDGLSNGQFDTDFFNNEANTQNDGIEDEDRVRT
ncbi:hypothetical protein [Alicyclobacillus sp. SO9]|nr:hypothetical protein [Alicyclobacillus sp. SO9]